MEKNDGRASFNLLKQGEVINEHAEQYLKVVVPGDVDIYNLPGVRIRRVNDGTLDFLVQAHHLEVIARFSHVLKKGPSTTRVLGRFVLYGVEQYLRLGASATPIGTVEISEEGMIDLDGKQVTPWPSGSPDHVAALRSSLVMMLQRSLEE